VSDLEPPKTLKVNVKGLAPRRAELARLVEWRKAISAELDTLSTGRPKLDGDVKRLEKAKAAADSETSTAAENVLARIKQRLPWSIAPTKSAPDCTTELQVARTALERLDAERASLEARIESLGNRILSVARRALYEHGAAIRQTYEATVGVLRDMLSQLVALDRVAGVGHEERMVVDFPAFAGPHPTIPVRVEETDIEAARQVWLKLLSAWRSDPRAEVNLEFPPHDPKAAETLVYHELTPTERALVDREFADAAVQPGSNI
jgi:hypothetical protein